MLLEIAIGLFLALLLILLSRRLYPGRDVKVWGSGLIIAAVIYVGFALWSGEWDWLPIEFLGVFLYAIPVYLATKFQWWWVGLGWGLHIIWDLVVHQHGHASHVPDWYPGACIGFDIAIAIYIFLYWKQTQ